MIIDLERFFARNRPTWQEMEKLLDRIECGDKPTYTEARRLHYLYERTSADLARLSTFAAESDAGAYLSALVGRAYAEIYETRRRKARFLPVRWFFGEFPRTFRRHIGAFGLAVAITIGGCGFGSFALAIDTDAKHVLMPFPGLEGDPGERVHKEEAGPNQNLRGHYARAGYTMFLLGWLMPHGVIEIPAILVAGQASFVLAGALLGRGDRRPRRERLRHATSSVVTLAGGAAVMLVWAGIVESFISQYHRPVLPYEAKIAFGFVELVLLTVFLAYSGRKDEIQ
jgi:hypothetical protein